MISEPASFSVSRGNKVESKKCHSMGCPKTNYILDPSWRMRELYQILVSTEDDQVKALSEGLEEEEGQGGALKGLFARWPKLPRLEGSRLLLSGGN